MGAGTSDLLETVTAVAAGMKRHYNYFIADESFKHVENNIVGLIPQCADAPRLIDRV